MQSICEILKRSSYLVLSSPAIMVCFHPQHVRKQSNEYILSILLFYKLHPKNLLRNRYQGNIQMFFDEGDGF